MSIPAAQSLLSPRDVADIHQLQLDGLATALALGSIALVLYRTDEATGEPVALPSTTVARRFANRQPGLRGSEAAQASDVAGDFRAYAPWDVLVGDRFVLPDGAGEITVGIVTKDQITTAPFVLDQGAP